MSEFLQFAFSGLTVGAIYALIALGFTLIFNTSKVINFAQGEFVMLGGMTAAFAVAAGIALPIAVLLALVVTIIFGILLYRLAIAPARGASPVTLIIITIGASIMMRGLAAAIFDKNFHGFQSPLGDTPISVGGAALLPQSLLVLAGVAIILVALWLFLSRTLTGKSMLATAENPLAAGLVGINTFDRVVVCGIGGDRRRRRNPGDADRADELFDRNLAGLEGICRRDARRRG